LTVVGTPHAADAHTMNAQSARSRRGLRAGAIAALAALMLAAVAATSIGAQPIGGGGLRQDIENVAEADGKRYNARDDTGRVMDTAKIIQDYTGTYIAVYHSLNQAEGRFHVSVATSTDLLNWTFRHDFGAGTHQPTIHPLANGLDGYVVAWEQDPDNHLAFRYFRNRADLLSGRIARSFDAPQTLSDCAEGTPNIYSVELNGGINRSVIDIGAHYFRDCDVDRQQRGTLTNFRTWQATPQPQVDAPLVAAGVAGNIGDRDDFTDRGRDYLLIEGQFTKGDFGTWRTFLYDAATGEADQLDIRTDGGSTAFANPTITFLRLPDGRRGFVATLFIPSEGAAPGEAGELIYFEGR
jgi:hypothetical protein